jgi:glutamate-1-semialdehyde 2,1-aminomutase
MSTTTKSEEIFEAGLTVTPGGVNSFTRALNPPRIFERAQGAYVYDVDGNRFLDYHAAFGPIILGHCDPDVNRAVKEAIDRIDLVGIGSTELELTLAARIARHLPSAEMVQLCNTGTEATYSAVRLARAVTGRKKLLKFQGCFHGSHDYLLRNIISAPERVGKVDPGSAGMLPAALENTLVAEFNNLDEVEQIVRKEGEDLAAIILEPIPHNIGCVMPRQDFLEGLRRIATAAGILLIFDEVITGFRHGLGGYQSHCKVTPDLTTLGKAMANGYPCAALCGRRDLMTRLSTAGGDVIFAGTYNAHPIATAAAVATIQALEDGEIYRRLFEQGDSMRREITALLRTRGVPSYVAGFGSVFVVYFFEGQPANYNDVLKNDSQLDRGFRASLFSQGVLANPLPLKRYHLMAAHSSSDLDFTLEAMEKALRDLA